jgi:hypothetical protein
MHTLGATRTHSTKLLKVATRKKISNHELYHRRSNNMLDLQVTNFTANKENLPPALDPQSKKSAP